MIITEYNEEWDKEASFNDGFRRGDEYGFKRGKDIGREEEKIAMVKTLLKVHNPIEYIVAATGLTEEEILKLALTPRETPMTIDEMRRELQRRLNKNRFAHSIGVANTAVKLAKRFGVDEQKAYVAGLLHDCARQFENDALPAQAEIRGIEIGEVERAMPLLLHAYISAKMISEVYGVNDAEISQAIYRHTVGAPDMTPLDKIIYFADMIEPNRNYPGVEKLRALAETAELNEIMLTAFSESIIFVVQKNSLVHPDTVAARNFLLLNK